MPELVRYAIEKVDLKIQVTVRTGNGATGQTSCPTGKFWSVYLQVPYLESRYPYQEVDGGSSKTDRILTKEWSVTSIGTHDYLTALILSREEHLVHVAAHEFFHIAQYLSSSIHDSPEHYSDNYADRYAIRKQREWRKLHSSIVYAQPDVIGIGATIKK